MTEHLPHTENDNHESLGSVQENTNHRRKSLSKEIRESFIISLKCLRYGAQFQSLTATVFFLINIDRVFTSWKVSSLRQFIVHTLSMFIFSCALFLLLFLFVDYFFSRSFARLFVRKKSLLMSISLYIIFCTLNLTLERIFGRSAIYGIVNTLFALNAGIRFFRVMSQLAKTQKSEENDMKYPTLLTDGTIQALKHSFSFTAIFYAFIIIIVVPLVKMNNYQQSLFLRVGVFPLLNVVVGFVQTFIFRKLSKVGMERRLFFLHVCLDFVSISGSIITLDFRQSNEEFLAILFFSAIFDTLSRISFPAQLWVLRSILHVRLSPSQFFRNRKRIKSISVVPSESHSSSNQSRFREISNSLWKMHGTQQSNHIRACFVVRRAIQESSFSISVFILLVSNYRNPSYIDYPSSAIGDLCFRMILQLIQQLVCNTVSTFIERRYQNLEYEFPHEDVYAGRFLYVCMNFCTAASFSFLLALAYQ
eukprot:TRINITY_DN10505_c0_g1_i1.p1 TRINITY_DN10505_c0_g1~~TRINITY_DN10505_c0_g1_i1.p1  ORF type:complete len:477 (+),score=55.37 TRINITY_DN10505_c0_g1_i1:113-1543(+)